MLRIERPFKKRMLEPTSFDEEGPTKRRKHDDTTPGKNAIPQGLWEKLPPELKQKIVLQTLEELLQQTIQPALEVFRQQREKPLFWDLPCVAQTRKISPGTIWNQYISRSKADFDECTGTLAQISGTRPETLIWPLRQVLKIKLDTFWHNRFLLARGRQHDRMIQPYEVTLPCKGRWAMPRANRQIDLRRTKKGIAIANSGTELKAVLRRISGGLDALSLDRPAHLTLKRPAYSTDDAVYMSGWRPGDRTTFPYGR